MIKTSINLQELRRKIYLKAKSEKTWSVMASVETGGVEIGSTRPWGYMVTTG